LIRNHFRYTSSKLAAEVLTDWKGHANHFTKVMPKDYKAVLLKMQQKSATQVKAS
jgi:glutamate synthase (NADPH/NADH) large chain